MAEWYYAAGADRQGPVSAEQVKALLASGRIDRNTLVWSDPMADWQPLGQTSLGAAASGPGSPFAGSAMPAGASAIPSGAWPAPGTLPAGPPVTGFGDAVRAFFANYANFKGRANRPAFWYAALFMVLLSLAASAVELAVFGTQSSFAPLTTLITLAVFIPSLSVSARRLHDTDRSGWWYLIIFVPLIGIIVLIVFWCQKGTQGPNRFG